LCGDAEQARSYLTALAGLTHPSRLLELEAYHNLAAQLALDDGQLARAERHQEVALDAARRLGLAFVEAVERIGSADICHAGGRSAESLEHLDRADAIARRMDSALVSARVAMSRAHVELALGHTEAGLGALRLGLRLAREHGYDCLLRWSRGMMSSLCERALREGIETALVARWIRRWRFRPSSGAVLGWPWRLEVYTLTREFRVLREGQRITFAGKAQRRPLELLQALIAFGGKQVPEQVLCEALWPDSDGDSAHQALSTTLHRLRKLIGSDAIERSDLALSLTPAEVWVDSLQLGASLARRSAPFGALLELYETSFLPHVHAWWAVAPRERFAELFVRHTLSLAHELELTQRFADAERLLRRGLDAEPGSERLAQALERHFEQRGEVAAALDARAARQKLAAARGRRAAS